MTYEEFNEYIKSRILEYLPTYYKEAEIASFYKDNELTGICIRFKYEAIGPCIPTKSFYTALVEGKDLNETLSEIASAILHAFASMYGSLFTPEEEEKCIGIKVLNKKRISLKLLSKISIITNRDISDLITSIRGDGSIFVDKDLLGFNYIDLPEDEESIKRIIRRMSPLEAFVREIIKSDCDYELVY